MTKKPKIEVHGLGFQLRPKGLTSFAIGKEMLLRLQEIIDHTRALARSAVYVGNQAEGKARLTNSSVRSPEKAANTLEVEP